MGSLAGLLSLVAQNDFIKLMISNVILCIIYSFVSCQIFITLFKIDTTKTQIIKLILVDSIFKSICSIIIPVTYFKPINIITTILLYKIFLKSKIENCILGELINTVVLISLEVLLFINFENKYGINIFSALITYRYKICIMALITLANLIMFLCVKISKITLKIYERINLKNRCMIILVLFLDSLVIMFYSIELYKFINSFPREMLIFLLTSLIMFFYISVKNILRVSKLEEQKLTINNLEAYNKTLSIMYDNIRGFKHDFSNFIQSLDGYIQIDDIEGIKSMNFSVSENCRNVCNMGILDPNIINNPAVYSLVTNKYYLALESDITMNIEITLDLQDLSIDSYDLCSVLGVLLDNSIDAAKDCEKKVINVRFIRDFKTNKKVILIENSYSDSNVDIGKIFEKGYSSKRENKEHGLGLWNVKRILKKFKNIKLVTSKDKMFCQKLEIE